MITMDEDATIVADYIKHSTGQQIGDALAVYGKRAIGLAADFVMGTFEATSGMIFARLVIAIAVGHRQQGRPERRRGPSTCTSRRSPSTWSTWALSCANEWSKGGRSGPTRRPTRS